MKCKHNPQANITRHKSPEIIEDICVTRHITRHNMTVLDMHSLHPQMFTPLYITYSAMIASRLVPQGRMALSLLNVIMQKSRTPDFTLPESAPGKDNLEVEKIK